MAGVAGVCAVLLIVLALSDVPSYSFSLGSSGLGATQLLDGDGDWACPLQYDRISWGDIEDGARPYLYGGKQRPNCTNCEKDVLWSHFCKFESHGPVCDKWHVNDLVKNYTHMGWRQVLQLTPCDLFKQFEGRTLWVTGDSMGLDMYKALKCFMYEFWDVEEGDVSIEELEDQEELKQEVSKYMSPTCVLLPRDSRVCYIRADVGGFLIDVLLPKFQQYGGQPQDIMVSNFGLHHSSKDDYKATLTRFREYLEANSSSLPDVFWQQTPPQHFKSFQGEYPGGDPPFECAALPLNLSSDGTMELLVEEGEDPDENAILLQGGWRNAMAHEVLGEVSGELITVAHTYNHSTPLYKFHRDNGKGHECTHYCFPSAPQAWVFGLYRALVHRYEGRRVGFSTPFADEL